VTTVTPTLEQTALTDLVLVRYALSSPTPKKIRDDVGKLLGTTISSEPFSELQTDLLAGGFLIQGRAKSFKLSDTGRERALRFLGLNELPPKANWTNIIAKYLFPQAVGMTTEAVAKLNKGDNLAALLLKRKYQLPSGTGTSLNNALEALVCQQLGFAEETTLSGLLQTVLSKMLGVEQPLSKKELAKTVPTYETGLKSTSAAELRSKFVRDWLSSKQPMQPKTPPVERESEQHESLDLATFANTVLALARSSPPQDRYYDNKVFIAPLYRASQGEPNFPRLSLADFKQRLLDANAQGLLQLVRADLVLAMDPKLVAESEIAYLNATFHFVLLE
jgi:hypothetical protein